jgi:hypothetical protein
VLEAMEEVVVGLTRALDSRVYVALGRGLWDFTAKEIFDYVEGLQEGRENQVRHARARAGHLGSRASAEGWRRLDAGGAGRGRGNAAAALTWPTSQAGSPWVWL